MKIKEKTIIKETLARGRRLTPVILAIQETEIKRSEVRSQPGQIVHETLSPKYTPQKGLVDWIKVKALISSPGTKKEKKGKKKESKKETLSWVTGDQVCNPSYLGG
jgi:hypothetical protein